AVNLFSAFYHPGLVVVSNKTMKLEAIVNHETSRIHTTCIVVSRAEAQPLHKAQAFKQLTDMSCCTLLCCTVLNSLLSIKNTIICRLTYSLLSPLRSEEHTSELQSHLN